MEKLYSFQKKLEDTKIFKIIFTIIILFTVLPFYDDFNNQTKNILNIVFLGIFGLEALIRTIIFIGYFFKQVTGRKLAKNWKPLLIDFVFLVIDIFATLTFTPILPDGLRLLRLLRLIKLSRYITSTFSEMGQIIGQPGIKKQILLTFGIIIVLTFFGAIIFSFIGLSEEGMNFFEITWRALMHLLMPDPLGEIDINTVQAGVLIISIVLALLGLIILSFIVGIGTEVVAELIEASKNKPLKFKNHIIIFGWNKNGASLINEIFDIMLDNLMTKTKVVVIQNVDPTLPDRLVKKSKQLTVRYYVDEPIEALEKANVMEAKSVIILSVMTEKADDSNAIQSILEVKSISDKDDTFILTATLEDPVNLMPGKHAGADEIVMPDIFIGSYLVQNILNPNLLSVYEELLVPTGNEIYISKLDDIYKFKNSDEKYISLYDIHNTLIENDCTFLGIIKKIDDKEFKGIANPFEWYDMDKKAIISYKVLPKEDIIGVISLADNGIVLDEALKQYEVQNKYSSPQIEEKPFIIKEESVNSTEKPLNVLIFGWNYSVPTIIQQLISLIEVPVNTTLFINASYNYPKSKISLIRKKINECLSNYYPEDELQDILKSNKISIKMGSYFSETDLFSVKVANIKNQDIIIMLPDEHKKTNPDADIFLVVLMLLGYYSKNSGQFSEKFKIYAHATTLESAKKLEEKIKIRDPKHLFNVISSERIIGSYLAQTALCRYIPKTYDSLLTNDDLCTMNVIKLKSILNDDECKSLISDNTINYKELSTFLLHKNILLIGFKLNDGVFINPTKDRWEIDATSDVILIYNSCKENEYLKKFDNVS